MEIAPEETFGIDVNLANINVLGDLVLLPRPIRIWLPPGYDDDDEVGHSVLYVHDGQNAMEDKDSWTGASWRLIGALTRLADHRLIVVDPLLLSALAPFCHCCLIVLEQAALLPLFHYRRRYGLQSAAESPAAADDPTGEEMWRRNAERARIAAPHCATCGQCEPMCPFDVPIVEYVQRIAAETPE